MTNKIKQILQISIIISILSVGLISCTPVTGTPNTYTTPTIEQPNQPQQEYVLRVEDITKTQEFIIKTAAKVSGEWTGTWEMGPIGETHRTRYFKLIIPPGCVWPRDLAETNETGICMWCFDLLASEVNIEENRYRDLRQHIVNALGL